MSTSTTTATPQTGPGWRDQEMRYHFRHGCGAVLASAVYDLLLRGGYCAACINQLPEHATDADWNACLIPASDWEQVQPPPLVATVNLPGDEPRGRQSTPDGAP